LGHFGTQYFKKLSPKLPMSSMRTITSHSSRAFNGALGNYAN
jgi:hypothetical protein